MARSYNGTHPGPRRSRPARGGFTLLEVLVAMAILSVMLLALYQAYGSNIYLQSFNRSLWRAVLHTQNELARYERMPPPPISVSEGDYDDDHPLAGFHWKRKITDAAPIPGVRVREVALEVSWNEGGVIRSYQAEVYVIPK